MTFLKASLNAQRKARGEAELTTPGLHQAGERGRREARDREGHAQARPQRRLLGGEKKRMEILQMALLQPTFCILDETDSGLDIDALRVVSEGVNTLREAGRGFLVITHYQRLLNYIVPDTVHVMSSGRIVKSGGKELALELEANGYADYRQSDAA
jgi:Fe-S cluster assembly ATP-binding protein